MYQYRTNGVSNLIQYNAFVHFYDHPEGYNIRDTKISRTAYYLQQQNYSINPPYASLTKYYSDQSPCI